MSCRKATQNNWIPACAGMMLCCLIATRIHLLLIGTQGAYHARLVL